MGRLIHLTMARDADPTARRAWNRAARWATAGNPDTPAEILAELAGDADWHVRFAVAGNPSAPPEILAELAGDPNPAVRWQAVLNPHAPREILRVPTLHPKQEEHHDD